MSEIYDLEIKCSFFVPMTNMCHGEHRERCRLFLKEWKAFASELPPITWEYSWAPKLLHSLYACGPEDAEEASRIYTSLVVWFGTNTGFSFMEKIMGAIDRSLPSYNNSANLRSLLGEWAIENSLYNKSGGAGGRRLQNILEEREEGKPRTPLTAFQTDIAERFFMFLVSESGVELLDRLKLVSDTFFENEKRARRAKSSMTLR